MTTATGGGFLSLNESHVDFKRQSEYISRKWVALLGVVLIFSTLDVSKHLRIRGEKLNGHSELIDCIEQYNAYLIEINKLIIAVENYSGRDYQEGYHKIVETFDQMRLGWEQDKPAEAILADVNRECDKQKKNYKKFIESILTKKIKHLTLMDAYNYTDRIKKCFSNDTDINIGALKELRKIEEELNG
jgi:hypothetical protein